MGAAEAAAVTGSGASGGGGSDALPALAAAAVDSTADLGHHSTMDDPVELLAENGGGRSKDIEHEASSESAEADEQSTLLQREHQRFGTTGFAHAGLFSKFTYLFVTPLVVMGARNKVRSPWGEALGSARQELPGSSACRCSGGAAAAELALHAALRRFMRSLGCEGVQKAVVTCRVAPLATCDCAIPCLCVAAPPRSHFPSCAVVSFD